MKEPTIIRYNTLQECFEEFAGEKHDPAQKMYWVGHDGKKPFRILVDKWLKGTNRKCWGWVQVSKRKIHIWIDEDCSSIEVITTLAHEIGHLQRPRYLIKADEEKKASLYGMVARMAAEIEQDLRNKEKS